MASSAPALHVPGRLTSGVRRRKAARCSCSATPQPRRPLRLLLLAAHYFAQLIACGLSSRSARSRSLFLRVAPSRRKRFGALAFAPPLLSASAARWLHSLRPRVSAFGCTEQASLAACPGKLLHQPPNNSFKPTPVRGLRSKVWLLWHPRLTAGSLRGGLTQALGVEKQLGAASTQCVSPSSFEALSSRCPLLRPAHCLRPQLAKRSYLLALPSGHTSPAQTLWSVGVRAAGFCLLRLQGGSTRCARVSRLSAAQSRPLSPVVLASCGISRLTIRSSRPRSAGSVQRSDCCGILASQLARSGAA